jgi:DNA-binding transcriptional LysR family regulator
MDLFSIRTFVSVKELQSFSKAGEQLFLTQPAVSKRIAALELDLGTRLFDRVGKKVLLTEAGAELYLRSKQILLELDDCRRAITNLAETMSGRLAFATSHHIGLHRLPPILLQFSSTYPEVELEIQFMDSEQAYTAVANGEVELALVTLPGSAIPNLQVSPIWQDPLALVVSSGHDLAFVGSDKDQVVSAEDVVAYPAILPGLGTYTRELITVAFSRLGLSLQVKLSTNYLETIKMLVSVGLGWGILPQSMVQESDLCQIRIPGISLERTLGVIRHRQRTLSKSAQAMLTMLHKDVPGQWL